MPGEEAGDAGVMTTAITALSGLMVAVLTGGFALIGKVFTGQMDGKIRKHELGCTTAQAVLTALDRVEGRIVALQEEQTEHLKYHMEHNGTRGNFLR